MNCKNATGRRSGQGPTDADADDRRLAQRRIEHAARKRGRQAARHAENISLGIFDIFAEQANARLGGQPGAKHFAHRFEHRERGLPFAGARVPSPRNSAAAEPRLGRSSALASNTTRGCSTIKRMFDRRQNLGPDAFFDCIDRGLRSSTAEQPQRKVLDWIARFAGGAAVVFAAIAASHRRRWNDRRGVRRGRRRWRRAASSESFRRSAQADGGREPRRGRRADESAGRKSFAAPRRRGKESKMFFRRSASRSNSRCLR